MKNVNTNRKPIAYNAIYAGDKKPVILSTVSIIAFCFANGRTYTLKPLNK